MSPIMADMARYPSEFEQVLVHTGQHYDQNISTVFFEELGLARYSAAHLGVGAEATRSGRAESSKSSSPC